MRQDLIEAIEQRRLIEFIYRNGGIRLVEPHDYGVRKGVERLLGYQVSGESRTGEAHGWKDFNVTYLLRLQLLDRCFRGTRADHQQRHRVWDALYARVK
jgi:hypothetical protein